jgi:hypothetical protein
MNEQINRSDQKDIPATVKFGNFLILQRRKLEMKASSVALQLAMQPSNYSKIESGVVRPPADPERLRKLGKAIELREQLIQAVRK